MTDGPAVPPAPSSRAAFLARIRHRFGVTGEAAQAAKGDQSPGTPGGDEAGGRGGLGALEARSYATTAGAEPPTLARRFCRELAAVSGEGRVVEEPAALHAALHRLVADGEARKVMLAEDEVVTGCRLEAVLAAVGAEMVAAGDPQAELGITGATAAIAETGTLVLTSDAPWGRGVSLLPPHHVALVPLSRLVSGVSGALALLRARSLLAAGDNPVLLPSSINLITGPSRSADLAGELSLGVHGPGRVTVFILAWWDEERDGQASR